jgi:hypothetical protein
MNPFWLVINMGEFGRVPTKRHETESSAREEAGRIAAKHPNISVFVVAAVSCYKATATVEHDDVAVAVPSVIQSKDDLPGYDYLGHPYATDCDGKRVYKNDTLRLVRPVACEGDTFPEGSILRAVDPDSPGPLNNVAVQTDRGLSMIIPAGHTRIVQAGG